MTEFRGGTWKAEYGEITERQQFRVGYVDQEIYEAYFPIGQLADLIAVLQGVIPLSLGVLSLGTQVQAKKVSAGYPTEVVIEPRSNTFPVETMRYDYGTNGDLISVLQGLQAAIGSGADAGDWDGSDILRPAYLGDDGFIPDRYTPPRLGTTPEEFGAVGDGVTDDTSAFARMIASNPAYVKLGAGKSYVVASNTILMPPGSLLEGNSSGNYNLGVPANAAVSKILVKKIPGYDPTSDGALDHANPTDNPTHWGVKTGDGCVVRNVKIIPQGTMGTQYYDANYPGAVRATTVGVSTPTENASVGLQVGRSSLIENVYTQSFFWGLSIDGVCKVLNSYVRECNVGIITRGADGAITNCDVLFCNTAGIRTNNAYWRFTACRIEWNARFGIDSASEGTFTGNLFDRNGWAGLRLRSGSWGQVVTGNYFSRNGVGGDGTDARWGWVSGPAHRAYVDTPTELSCHILIDYQRAVAVIGNRYRHGRDDDNAGMDGPRYIYSSQGSDGATALDDVEIYANAGVRGATSAANGYSSSTAYGAGAIAGGTDTNFRDFLNNYGFGMRNGVRTTGDIHTANGLIRAQGFVNSVTTAVNVSTIDVPIKAGRSGFVVLKMATSGAALMSVIYFSRNQGSTGSAGTVTLVENKIGAGVTSATLVADTAENDRLTVVMSAQRWTNYNIVYAS